VFAVRQTVSKRIGDYLHEYIIFDIEKIYWRGLSYNSHPDAVKLLRENLDKIDWGFLSQNTHTPIHLNY
jgi:hypothetical protein